jgi:phosphatidylserine/phosphatidylglycerophosphate/cardiolipin synthase-like enzyme
MSPRKSARSIKSSGGSTGTLIVLAVVLLLGAIFTLTGTDLLGLFKGSQPVNTTPIVLPTKTPAPARPSPVATYTPSPIPPTDIPAPGAPATATSSTPKADWWEVYFVNSVNFSDKQSVEYSKSLPPELMKGSITEKLIQHIDQAQKTIHIASFETDLNDVANALIRAKNRGVDVRWITDDEYGIAADTKPGHGQFAMLKKASIEIVDDKRSALMHDKFWLFDGQTTWTGSTNVTVSGMFEQNNNVIVIESPELTAMYERQWQDMWNGQFNAKSPSAMDQQSITIQGTTIQVLFSPEDKVVNHILPYIQNAKKSIRFMIFTYTQPDMGNAMIERFKNGVAVQGVFETTGSETEYGEMTPLYCAKVPVRQDGNPEIMHHKVIVIDEHIVITGSFNFTDSADQNNNENAIIIDNADIAKLYIAEFQRVWAAGHDPDPAKIKCK